MTSVQNVDDVEDGLSPSAKVRNAIDATSTVSGASQSGSKLAYQLLKLATTENCFVKDAASNLLEDLRELETTWLFLERSAWNLATCRTTLAV